MKKIAIHTLRSLLGAVFIYSSITKILSVEMFEMFVYQNTPFSMLISAVGVRMLIGAEFFLGLLLIFNLFTQKVLKAIIVFLIAFTGFLGYKLLRGESAENCHCFGEVMPLDAIESIIKNIVLAAIAVLLILIPIKQWQFKYRKPLFAALAILALVLPIMLFPPDIFFKDKFSSNDRVGKRFAIEKIKDLSLLGESVDIMHGKRIVCMYSLRCIYCKRSAQKTSAVYNKMENKPKVVYFFIGDLQYLESFWNDSKSIRFPHQVIDPSAFYELAGAELPMVYFLEDGIIKKQFHYSDVFDEDYLSFFEKQ